MLLCESHFFKKVICISYLVNDEENISDVERDVPADAWYTNEVNFCIEVGLVKTEKLPGRLNVKRKANSFYNQHIEDENKTTYLYAAALATAEENGSGGIVVTAPTCGSSGVLPAVLKYSKLYLSFKI